MIAARYGHLCRRAGFLGKVLDEWIADSQEFIRTKLPHLIVIAVIAFFLNQLLRLVTEPMVRVAERHAAARRASAR